MKQRFRPLLSAEPRGADATTAGGTKRAWSSIMNVSRAFFNLARYSNSQGGMTPECSLRRQRPFAFSTGWDLERLMYK